MERNIEISSYFVGGIPPFLMFEREYESLFSVIETHKNDNFYKSRNPAAEIAMIGVLAQFEAFCKHQFAAIINILPTLLTNFVEKRKQTMIELSSINALSGEFEKNIGFIVAEKYDFGTVHAINQLFFDLLHVSPFNDAETKQFNSILFKRNLLVHHGGFYTLQYLKENYAPDDIKKRAFKEAMAIDTEECHQLCEFLFDMAVGITRTTGHVLKNKLQLELSTREIQNLAADELFQAVWDIIE